MSFGGVFAKLIMNTTGKDMTYKDSFMTSQSDWWFMDATYDGKYFRVISIGDEGVIKFYKKHPIDQNIPTETLRLVAV